MSEGGADGGGSGKLSMPPNPASAELACPGWLGWDGCCEADWAGSIREASGGGGGMSRLKS